MSGRDSNDPMGSEQSAEDMRIPEGVSLGQFSQHPSWHRQVDPDGEDVPAPGHRHPYQMMSFCDARQLARASTTGIGHDTPCVKARSGRRS